MPTIITLHDPLGINRRETDTAPEGTLLLSWLIERFGKNGFDVPTKVYRGNVDESRELHLAEHIETGLPLLKDDVIIICRVPQGTEVAIFVIAFIVSLILVSLVPKPDIPEYQQAQQSPNNSLTAQANIARLLQRIPDVYGKNKAYPDLIANSYFEFIDQVKHQTEYMCFGRGEYLVESIKSGDTLISDIPNSTATVYEPFTRPVELLSAQQSNSVDGQEVTGPNVPALSIGPAAVRFTANNTLTGDDPVLSRFEDLVVGATFTITNAQATRTVTGSADISFNGAVITGSFIPAFSVGQIANITGSVSNNIQVEIASSSTTAIGCIDPITGAAIAFTTESNTSATISTIYDNNGVYTLNAYTETIDLINVPPDPTTYTVVVDETTFAFVAVAEAASMASTANKDNFVGPFAVPGNPDQVWFNIEFPRGLENGGNPTTVRLNLQLQEVDGGGAPIGSPEPNYVDFTDGTIDARSYTQKITPLSPGSRYTAQVFRTTNEGSANDTAKWTGLFGMGEVTVSDFGDVTTVLVNTRATEQATRAQERKFNAVITRKLITYENGSLTTSTQPTARMADAMLHILTDSKAGNKPASQVDLDALFAIQDALDADATYGDKLGRFCYTFSDSNSPVSDEILACANACRVFVTRGGDMVNFARDEKQDTRVTLFNQRNKKPDSEKKTVSLQKPNDPDGVLLEWSDETTGEAGTITMPETSAPTNPTTIKAAGLRNYEQAWNRARFEYLRIVYQRQKVSTSVTAEGLFVTLGNRVANVDGTLIRSQGGEVEAIDGLTTTTSERVDFEGASSASVILRDDDGSVSAPVQVTPGSQPNQIILASLPFDVKVRGDLGYQVGTLYTFSPNSDHTAGDYMISSVQPSSDGYVTIGMTNYTDAIYAPDTETPTPQV